MRLTQPGTMLVSPLSQEGFTASGIYVAHAKNNHFVKPCLSFVIKHVTAHDQAWPWNLAGDVVRTLDKINDHHIVPDALAAVLPQIAFHVRDSLPAISPSAKVNVGK